MSSFLQIFDPLSGPQPMRKRRRNPFWRFRRFLFLVVLLGVGAIGAVLYTFSQTDLPEDQFETIAQTSFLCTAEVRNNCGPDNATALLSTGGEDREIVTFDELPESLINAVVATEDQDFWEHQGIDPRGIARAGYQFVRVELGQGGVVQGGSTITQQYVKLAFNDADRNLIRKAREAIRAVKLEQDLARECQERGNLGDRTPERCAKEEILTRYLNRAYFGRGASGVQAASRVYFGKDVSELTLAESAYIAGLLRNPLAADPIDNPDEANRRRTTSLELMLEAGYITLDEAMAANEAPWSIVEEVDREGLGEVVGAEWGTEYFVEEVRKQLAELYPNGEIYTSGLRVYTTLDHDMQAAAFRAAHFPRPDENLEERGSPEIGPGYLDLANPNDPSAAIVSLDSDGRVLAMLGGTNFDDDEFNLATSSGGLGRQPGSTFKPIGMAVALEQGYSARSFYPAIPGVTRIPECGPPGDPWQVTGGSSGQYRYRDLVDSLVWSSNVVFAQLVVDIGPSQVAQAAIDMGISSNFVDESIDQVPCSVILGSVEVPVIEMAEAYSVFERGGSHLDPVLIERVENSRGEVICWYPVDGICADGPDRTPDPVFAAETVAQLTYTMTQVAAFGTGRAATFSEERAVAGKTGTSQNNVDGWFAGYTCGMTTVVWVGHAGETQYPMIDFRMPREDGTIATPRNEDGSYVNNRDWADLQGGNMPTWIWSAYMEEVTASLPPCPELVTQDEFPGVRLNQELSTTTLPPCGVELDRWGYPYGDGPDSFRYLTTTTTAPPTTTTTAPPSTDPGDTQPPDSQPQGPPLANTNEGNEGNQGNEGEPPPESTTSTTAPCVPPELWAVQADPTATVPAAVPPGDGGDGGGGDGGGGDGGSPQPTVPGDGN